MLFFFFFFPGCFFEINALRLDMIFLQISTNIPKQFSRLCCIRLSGLVNILRNKCKSPTLPPPTLKHVIVLYFRFKQCNIKKKINYTLLKPFDNRTVTLWRLWQLWTEMAPYLSSMTLPSFVFFNYLKYSVTYIKIKLLFIHSSYYYYTYCLIN